jgi:hypothetical protein
MNHKSNHFIMKRKTGFLSILILLSVPMFFSFKSRPQTETLTLQNAMASNYITCTFENNRGVTHYNKCLLAHISNTSGKILNIQVDNGTQVIPEDSAYQNLVVTQNVFVTLNPGDSKSIAMNAMCTEPHDMAPYSNVMHYRMTRSADGVMKAVVDLIDKNSYFNSEGQQAVWCVASDRPLDEISGYDTTAVKKLQQLISKLTGKKIPPRPKDDDYVHNYYAPPRVKKITVGGEFEFSFAKPKDILIDMFDKNNVLVRELYKKDGEPAGVHIQKYEFDASVYTDKSYYIRLVADGKVKLESELKMD